MRVLVLLVRTVGGGSRRRETSLRTVTAAIAEHMTLGGVLNMTTTEGPAAPAASLRPAFRRLEATISRAERCPNVAARTRSQQSAFTQACGAYGDSDSFCACLWAKVEKSTIPQRLIRRKRDQVRVFLRVARDRRHIHG